MRYLAPPETRASGLGAINKLDLDNQLDEVVTALELKVRPNPDFIFNSNFLPQRSERIVN